MRELNIKEVSSVGGAIASPSEVFGGAAQGGTLGILSGVAIGL